MHFDIKDITEVFKFLSIIDSGEVILESKKGQKLVNFFSISSIRGDAILVTCDTTSDNEKDIMFCFDYAKLKTFLKTSSANMNRIIEMDLTNDNTGIIQYNNLKRFFRLNKFDTNITNLEQKLSFKSNLEICANRKELENLIGCALEVGNQYFDITYDEDSIIIKSKNILDSFEGKMNVKTTTCNKNSKMHYSFTSSTYNAIQNLKSDEIELYFSTNILLIKSQVDKIGIKYYDRPLIN